MKADRPDVPVNDPHAQLERQFLAEFLSTRGLTLESLRNLPDDQAQALLKEASLFASGRLSEVESRAHYIHDMHQVQAPLPRDAHRTGGTED